MSLLDRYRKPGGYKQLVEFLETCDQAKQEKIMNIIANEDQVLANDLKTKMITAEKILSWPANKLADITDALPIQFLAVLMHDADKTHFENATSCLSNAKKLKLQTMLIEIKPTDGQKVAAGYKLIECVRELIKSGKIQIQNYDPELHIEQSAKLA